MGVWERVRQWYDGKTAPIPNEPGSTVVFIGFETHRHWTSKAAHAVVDFYLAHWQWIWSTIIGLVGIVVAVLALK